MKSDGFIVAVLTIFLAGAFAGCTKQAPQQQSSAAAGANVMPVISDDDTSCEYPGGASMEIKNMVPDRQTAAIIGYNVLKGIYGEEQMASENPFHVCLKDDSVWVVEGSLDTTGGDLKGGVAHIEISRRDARVIKYYHGE